MAHRTLKQRTVRADCSNRLANEKLHRVLCMVADLLNHTSKRLGHGMEWKLGGRHEDRRRSAKPIDRAEIILIGKCGESDTTSGLDPYPTIGEVVDLHVFAEVRAKFQRLYDSYLESIEREGADLLRSQRAQGNIRGELSTIEEEAQGNIAKPDSTPVVDALGPESSWSPRRQRPDA